MFLYTGQIQEEEEKEAQETRQKKEKEGSFSFRHGARLMPVSLRFSRRVVFAADLHKTLLSSFGHHN